MFGLNPTLLIYPKKIQGKRLFVGETDSSKPPIIFYSPFVVKSIQSLPKVFSKKDFLELTSLAESDALWDFLADRKIFLLVEEIKSTFPTLENWSDYNWNEAFKYHYSTKDYPFLDMSIRGSGTKDKERMLRYLDEKPIPNIYQDFETESSIFLEKVEQVGDLDLKIRKMSREEKRSQRGLSILFDLCFGERSQQQFIEGLFLRKSVPSGGSRHPVEVFFVVFDEQLFDPGLYHYNVKKHTLDLIKNGNFYQQCESATFDLFKKFNNKPKGLFVFTCLPERAMWRYRDSRSWRAILVDLGHSVMLWRKICDLLGFERYTYQKFEDDKLNDVLKLNLTEQIPLYVGTII